jgi:orotate phosphoribosyltransferase-like protein
MPKIDIQKAIALKDQGKSIQEIADHFGVTNNAVYARFKRAPSKEDLLARAYLVRDVRRLRYRLYTCGAIAKELGASERVVRHIIDKHGLNFVQAKDVRGPNDA